MNEPTPDQIAEAERVIRYFDWNNYGMDQVGHAIDEHPAYQEWIVDLAKQAASAVLNARGAS